MLNAITSTWRNPKYVSLATFMLRTLSHHGVHFLYLGSPILITTDFAGASNEPPRLDSSTMCGKSHEGLFYRAFRRPALARDRIDHGGDHQATTFSFGDVARFRLYSNMVQRMYSTCSGSSPKGNHASWQRQPHYMGQLRWCLGIDNNVDLREIVDLSTAVDFKRCLGDPQMNINTSRRKRTSRHRVVFSV
jgi:hypothetical protein